MLGPARDKLGPGLGKFAARVLLVLDSFVELPLPLAEALLGIQAPPALDMPGPALDMPGPAIDMPGPWPQGLLAELASSFTCFYFKIGESRRRTWSVQHRLKEKKNNARMVYRTTLHCLS
jgi:hypothetical protein